MESDEQIEWGVTKYQGRGGLEDDRAFILWEVNCLVWRKKNYDVYQFISWPIKFGALRSFVRSHYNYRKNNHTTMCKQAWLNIGYIQESWRMMVAANQSNKTLPDCLNWNATTWSQPYLNAAMLADVMCDLCVCISPWFQRRSLNALEPFPIERIRFCSLWLRCAEFWM